MQPQLTALPYRPDAVLDYFTPLAGQPWAMLLHSSNSSHPDSRYDILVAAPVVTLVTHDGVTEIRRGGDDRESRHDDPFALVQQELTAAGMTALPNASLPFLEGGGRSAILATISPATSKPCLRWRNRKYLCRKWR